MKVEGASPLRADAAIRGIPVLFGIPKAAYTADSTDPRIAAALHFAQQVVQNQGHVSDEGVAEVRQAGYGDAEIAEFIRHVALNVFTNYFNSVAQTEVDFPRTGKLVPARS